MARLVQTFRRMDLLDLVRGTLIEFWGNSQNQDGTPLDLTGYTAVAQIRQTPASTTFAAFTCTVDGPTGRVAFRMPSAESDKLVFSEGVWDSFLADASGERYPYAAGRVTIKDDVTPLIP